MLAVGYALNISRLTSNYYQVSRAAGFGLGAFLGYDWWVGDQWSLGGLIRMSAAVARRHADAADLAINSNAITFMLSTVYQ